MIILPQRNKNIINNLLNSKHQLNDYELSKQECYNPCLPIFCEKLNNIDGLIDALTLLRDWQRIYPKYINNISIDDNKISFYFYKSLVNMTNIDVISNLLSIKLAIFFECLQQLEKYFNIIDLDIVKYDTPIFNKWSYAEPAISYMKYRNESMGIFIHYNAKITKEINSTENIFLSLQHNFEIYYGETQHCVELCNPNMYEEIIKICKNIFNME